MKILFVTATRIGDAALSSGMLAHLLGQHPGARVTVVCGAPAAPLFEAVPGLDRLRVIEKRSFHGQRSGLMHVAAAAGTPTLGLFGPSPEWRYGPWGAHCAVARTRESCDELVGAPDFDHRSQRSLMEGLSVETAYDSLAHLYANVKDGGRGGAA